MKAANGRLNGRRGQLEAGELVLVMIIVLLLIMLGLVAYSQMKTSGLEEAGRRISSLDVIELANEALSLKEISCTKESNCLDLHRLRVAGGEALAGQSVNLSPYYEPRFGFALINVTHIYPEGESWLVYSNQPSVFSSADTLNVPVRLFNATSKKYSFGVMKVVKYR